ncbi:methylamine utilization protein [Phenylobacterium sp.]|jgi:plastocyanin|uniref:methylamine utilization protein n=1 Tax=Phenylobacterium sp. TaxID=1871053 RepID=UPI002F94167A
MRTTALLLAVLCFAAPARAGDLAVSFATPRGQPITDAVVMVRPASGAARARVAGPYRMAQKDMAFEPYVLIVPVGAEVAFPNLDTVRHHVYSFSPAKRFELKLYGRDQTRFVRFDKAGVVGIGCNIHDNMSAFVRVVDTPFAVKTTADGALLRDLPPGPARVVVWHPLLKTAGGEIARDVTIPASGAVRIAFAGELRSPRLRHGGY